MKNKLIRLIALSFLISGCGNLERIHALDKKTDSDIENAERHIKKLRENKPVIQEAATQWINTTPIIEKADNKKKVPRCPVVINTREPISLAQITQRIIENCHISVTVMPDVWNYLNGTTVGATQQIKGDIPAPDISGMLPLASVGGVVSQGGQGMSIASGTGTSLPELNVSGLSSLLETVSGRMGISWRYENGRITLYYLETRIFPVTYMDSQISYNAKVISGTMSSNGSSGGSGSGSSSLSGDASNTQTTTVDMKAALYADVKSAVSTMLTPGVGRMFMSTGFITVTDNPQVLDIVESFVKKRNAEMKRQVVLNVEILSIKKFSQEQVGIDWNAVFNDSHLGLSLTSAFTGAADNVVTGGVSIVDGKLTGSKAFMKALSQQGKVSVITQHSAITKNLTLVPMQVANQKGFVEGVTTESTANVGTSTSLNTATITTGFNMTLLPFIQPDSQMLQLLFSMSISDKPIITTYESGGSKAQLPDVDLKTINQTVDLKSGQTVILSGFQQVNHKSDKQGVGSPSFFGLGGGMNGENDKTLMVVLITPDIIG
ncbi:PilN family type IVB pilus formation outer membrane protein [Salmonella enterica]|nr:PilN family type IVB pilus formation outer membrane protein [Salmonella enterica]